ncbi:class I SAM-dependent methyltransferase [Lysinibacillus pakistanensis]|uniref:S-adenosyl-L-methionine-dependent methyltransferase n=1 Tax=Lysinibacillus pakistanensis TaxID=759811 RepID=A0AAX3WRX8_9BACI|nr:class I SAM-dependent methyltransferase [Lysinibacillus pakistanensis]MDM5233868.1 class I SAM-dependent methyltransferase [Lysinibacillus pakistanensis]WHY44481.1 class I SAM-dependent methyltransferase [Lysinibacillus pakistanensis]WHY49489.1 class I SAM-dependent methyltransferase [Lysinibacillus pakistanensis]
MKKSESSLTSLIAAFSRAYHSQNDAPKIFDDYLAKDLITKHEFNNIQENMVQGIQFFNKNIAEKLKGDSEELLKWIVQVQLSPTPLARAAYCEKVLLNEVRLGVQQYVILGAGLDTFSLRHPELDSTLEIFEIDHPATQEFKKNRLDFANFKLPNNLHFVPMDFTKEFSYLYLMESGFNNKKTFFSLLGVSYYLTKEEISNLLNHLFANLPSGSSIVMDYADENLFKEKGISDRVSNMVKMAAASGEPMKSCFTYSEMELLLEKSNLLIYEHISPKAIQNLYFKKRKDYLTAFETIHYIHAVKK